jgi:hypothetical protein
MSPRRLSTTTLLLLIMEISSVFGYSSSTATRPFARRFAVELEEYSSIVVERGEALDGKKTKPTFYYDLGLGKNKPVYGGTLQKNDPVDATKFLVEHESVRAHPSPFGQAQPSQQAEPKKKRILPEVQLERRSTDILTIQNDGIVVIPHISVTSKAQLDLNTVWVEMMIHSEQMKLVPVTDV